MIKSILKIAGAPATIAALLLFGTEGGRKLTKKATKQALKGGMMAADKCKELAGAAKESSTNLIGQVKESANTLINEVKAERKSKC